VRRRRAWGKIGAALLLLVVCAPAAAADRRARFVVPPPPVLAPDVSAPELSAVSVGRRRGGALLRVTASEPAMLTLRIEHAVRGRRYRRLPGSRSYVLVGGRNAIRIKGLRAGRYRVRGVAVDAAGNRARLAPVAFTVARRAS
jgi:hypothetical protein